MKYSLVLLLVFVLMPFGLSAAESASSFGSIAIPAPEAPKNAQQCVEPVDVMRKNHMQFLLHQRDETVIEGVRSKKYSLVGCIDCHNPADSEKVVRYEDPQHFCAGCHLYTSVKIDCFECHADRGLESLEQSQLSDQPLHSMATGNWPYSSGRLSAKSLINKYREKPGVD